MFTPFSIGSRVCIGQHFALLETKLIIIRMISKYQLNLKEGYVHLLKTISLYGPVNPMIIELKDLS